LSAKQSEFQNLADEERQLQMAVNVEQQNLAKLLKNDRDVEENIDKVRKVDFIFVQNKLSIIVQSNKIVNQLREQRQFLIEKLAQLEEIVATNDLSIFDQNPSLMAMDDEEKLNQVH